MKNNYELYLKCRQENPDFIYNGYNISQNEDKLIIDYDLSIAGLADFAPHWEISKPNKNDIDLDDKCLNELVFSLGMVELVSYWKITCSPNVYVKCASLTDSQILWWKKLYKKGLGEFFYTNSINADDDFMTIYSNSNAPSFTSNKNKVDDNKVLIPIGGGKDSAVTLELLKDYADRYCYIINPRMATRDTVRVGNIPQDKVVVANRTLDKNMLELNKQGYLNGHTPFSAIVAFSSALAAYMYGIKYVALSNESSANESTVHNSDVNHQYSKSLEFETDFINYEKDNISSGVSYFSLLRPIAEITIAKIFSHLEAYHPVFQSCNIGSKEDRWCAACPKCLFVYIILSPFLSVDKMVKIFGKDMLNDITLKDTFEQLVGLDEEKPFECVGSCDEVNAAMQALLERYENSGEDMPKLLEHYKSLNIKECYNLDKICSEFDCNNNVPEKFIKAVKDNI